MHPSTRALRQRSVLTMAAATGVLLMTTGGLPSLTSAARADGPTLDRDDPTVQVAAGGRVTYADPDATGPTGRVTGTLETIVVEPAPTPAGQLVEHAAGDTQYAVVSASGRLRPLDLDADLPTSTDGGRVVAEVTASGSVATATVTPPTEERTAAAAPVVPPAPGAHHLYLAIADNRGSYPTGTLESDITGDVTKVLNRWVSEANGYLTSFDLTATKHFNLAGDCTSGANNWNEARALFPGVSFTKGNHLAVVTGSGACVFGLGTVGSGLTSGGYSSVSYTKSVLWQSLAHELGHNVGLEHTNSDTCASGACTEHEYGNHYNVMGVSFGGGIPTTALDTDQRTQLGITDAGEVSAPSITAGSSTASGSVDLRGRGTTSGLRGMRIVDPVDGSIWFVDYRNRAGRDAGSYYDKYGTTSTGYQPGVTVERLDDDGVGTDLQSWASTAASAGYDYFRPAGTSWTSTSGGITLTVQSATVGDTGTARVAYALERTPTTQPNPPATSTPPASSTPASTAGSSTTSSLGGSRPSVKVAGKRPAPIRIGRRVQAVLGGYAVAPTSVTYQWYLDAAPVAGATASTYRLGRSARGKRASVVVTASRPGYATSVLSSAPTGRVKRG